MWSSRIGCLSRENVTYSLGTLFLIMHAMVTDDEAPVPSPPPSPSNSGNSRSLVILPFRLWYGRHGRP